MEIAATTFGRIERGVVPYDQDFLEVAADVLRCDPWDLIHRDPWKEGEVIDLMRTMDDARRKQVEDYIRFLAQSKAS